MKLDDLKKPFIPEDIEWRVQRSGIKNGKGWAMVLAYVTNRAIMDRLDEVCGPAHWRNEFSEAPGGEGGILCGLSIEVSPNNWVVKYDGAERTQVEAVKGGFSDSMKRAAVQWGIGRYLYNLETKFVQITESGQRRIAITDKQTGEKINGYWSDPVLPEWALPKPDRKLNEKGGQDESVKQIDE